VSASGQILTTLDSVGGRSAGAFVGLAGFASLPTTLMLPALIDESATART